MSDQQSEMRGNWDGWTHSVQDCLAPDGHRQQPVCPMCARGLMHTQVEHERLEKAVPAKELTRRART